MVKRKPNGWTIVELLIVVAIVGAICMIAPTIMTETTRFFILNRTKLELQEEARNSMAIITRELRQAQSSTIVIDRVTPTQPYYSRLSFTKVGDTQTYTIYQSSNSLVLTMNTTTSTLTKNLAYLAFTFPRSDDMTILSVSMTLQKRIYGGSFKALHMASERVRVMN